MGRDKEVGIKFMRVIIMGKIIITRDIITIKKTETEETEETGEIEEIEGTEIETDTITEEITDTAVVIIITTDTITIINNTITNILKISNISSNSTTRTIIPPVQTITNKIDKIGTDYLNLNSNLIFNIFLHFYTQLFYKLTWCILLFVMYFCDSYDLFQIRLSLKFLSYLYIN
jgi:hypothetical protein